MTRDPNNTAFFVEGAMFRVVLSLDKRSLANATILQKDTDLSWTAVKQCLKELETLGLIRREKEGNKMIVFKQAEFQTLADSMYNVRLIVKGCEK